MTTFWSDACAAAVERAATRAPDTPDSRGLCFKPRFGKAEASGVGLPVSRRD